MPKQIDIDKLLDSDDLELKEIDSLREGELSRAIRWAAFWLLIAIAGFFIVAAALDLLGLIDLAERADTVWDNIKVLFGALIGYLLSTDPRK